MTRSYRHSDWEIPALENPLTLFAKNERYRQKIPQRDTKSDP